MRTRIAALGFFWSSCAMMNKLSTVQTARLDSAPFYKNYNKFAPDSAAVIYHLPVDIPDRYKTEPFHKPRYNLLQPLLDTMPALIDDL